MHKAVTPPGHLSRLHVSLVCVIFALAAAAAALAFMVAISTSRDDSSLRETSELVGTVAGESAAVADRYLAAIESATTQVAGWTSTPGTDEDVVNSALTSLVAAFDYFDGAYIGYPDGSFVYVHRDDLHSAGGYRLKRIGSDQTAASEVATMQTLDADLRPMETTTERDLFDPRTRPWYAAASATNDAWTGPYTFHTSGERGVTRATAVRREGQLTAVVGIDLRIADLTAFLDERRPSHRSIVVVSDNNGRVIARSTKAPDNDQVEHIAETVLASSPTEASLERRPIVDVHSVENIGQVISAVVTKPVDEDSQWRLSIITPKEDLVTSATTSADRLANALFAIGLFGVIILVIALAAAVAYVRRLHDLAMFDPLTGLLRRSAAMAALERLVDNVGPDETVSLMVLDLDGFKTINDRNGHEWGDRVLQRVAERLTSAAEGQAIVGRLGGDEFVVISALAEDSPMFEEPSTILGSIERPLLVGERNTAVTASAGVSSCTTEDRKSPDQMLREADVALYNAKEMGSVGPVHFDSTMQLRSSREAERRRTLERAIRRNQFEVYFQPEIDLATGDVVGAEALLRLHRNGGSVPVEADAFVSDLEHFDLLDQLLPTIFEGATELAMRYSDRPFKIRINLAAPQLANRDLEPMLQRAIAAAPHASYCLELTERSVLSVSEQTVDKLRRVRSMGVSIALDDFGTGHASLTQLYRLPVDAIKIDRSFVDDLRSGRAEQSIAAAILELGAMLNIEVIAEGIETTNQHQTLRELGCRSGQGFLFGRAVSSDSFFDRWPRAVLGAPA